MTHRVGAKGQVVIPKEMRDQLGLQPGDRVDFALEDDTVRVRPIKAKSALGGSMRGFDLVGMLEAEHRAERR